MLKKIKYYNSDLIDIEETFSKHVPGRKSMMDEITGLEELFEAMNEADVPYKDPANAVYFDGSISPVMFVGEAPGEDEVIQKKPFVGRSGQLLQGMLDAAGIKRSRVYVTNAIVWRPPQNRTPLPTEISAMRPYLLKHIELIKPKILIFVGGIATRCFNDSAVAISRIRGRWSSSSLCPNIMSIFHPSFLLRSPTHKKETWEDIMEIRDKMLTEGLESFLSEENLLWG